MLVQDVVNLLNKNFPEKLQYSWDNSGLNIGDESKEVEKILLSLEVTEEVIEEAIEKGANMIISHHPFLFSKMNKIKKSDIKGKLVYRLIQNDISVYCMHTNYDIAFDGLNDYFMEICGIETTGILEAIGNDENYRDNKTYGLGRIGKIESMPAVDFLKKVKKSLGIDTIRYVGDLEKMVENIAVVTGSGAEFFEMAKDMNLDLLLTGDMKYHQAMDSLALGMGVADCGHYGSERIFSEAMYRFLTSEIEGIEVLKTETLFDPFKEI